MLKDDDLDKSAKIKYFVLREHIYTLLHHKEKVDTWVNFSNKNYSQYMLHKLKSL